MKKILLSFGLFLTLFNELSAQCPIAYNYDDNGNRIRKQLLMCKTNSIEEDSSRTLQADVFPNPVTMSLKVSFQSVENEEQPSSILLFDLTGKLLVEKQNIAELTEIDFSNYSSGTYFLKVLSESKSKEWAIIKENN